MINIQLVREHPDLIDFALKNRGLSPVSENLLAQDQVIRHLQDQLQSRQNERNELAKKIAQQKQQGHDTQVELERGAALRQEINQLEQQLNDKQAELHEILSRVPNLPSPDIPVGKDANDNVVTKTWGEPRAFKFTPQDHVALGEKLDGSMDFATAAKMSGARFVVLKGWLARLERALAAFMLDTHTSEFGYTEISPPLMLKSDALYGVGQLPKFAEDLFKISDHDLWLLSTAEVPLSNLVADKILDENQLPLRVTAHTPCFRAEAGAAGRDTRGMIRMHQFYKVELVSITRPEESSAELERMTCAASTILERLELPYRVVMLCTGDLGFAARKTYDLEVWFPTQNCYREISSCSNCEDFQARRLKARYRPSTSGGDGKPAKPQFVHTLNGSGLAVGRTLAALLENHQNEDGSIYIPPALRPYLGGIEAIKRSG